MSQVKILNDFLIPEITNIIMKYNLPTILINFHKRRDVNKQIANFKKLIAYDDYDIRNFYGTPYFNDYVRFLKITNKL